MASFNYDSKGLSDVDPACRCHQSNIMLDSIFRANIAQFVNCSLCVRVCMCVYISGDILDSFHSWRQGAQFSHYYIRGLGEILSYKGLRQS